jgi:hypothetical protein
MNGLSDIMKRFFTRHLNRSGLTTAALFVFMGVTDLFRFRNHDRSGAVEAAIIFFVVMPAFALWARRLPATDPKTEGNSPSFQ